MKKNITSFIVGLIFALGLGISGMTQPLKVMGFLDITGAFDPSLLFVMIGAIAFHFVSYRLIRKKNKSPLLQKEWMVPTNKKITPALIIGSFIFGIGWALGGFCPGPALTGLASFEIRPAVFVLSMIGGMLLFNSTKRFH
ncbi:MAG: YeeE/YedE family protein [Rhizobacter sp.]|nr:YeeE/YedE family protein [Bacteriovorax sp.]